MRALTVRSLSRGALLAVGLYAQGAAAAQDPFRKEGWLTPGLHTDRHYGR